MNRIDRIGTLKTRPGAAPAPVAVLLFLAAVLLTFTLRGSSGFLDVDGSRLYYELAGQGEPIVFIHDGHMHRESWDAQWNYFSNQYRVIRYDRRGYGQSTPATAPYSNVEDLQRLLVRLGVSNAVIVGCSAGGKLAIDFALEHPEFVRRLVLAGAVVSGLDFSDHFNRRVDEGFRPLRERNDVGTTVTNWTNDRWLIGATNTAAKERFRQLLQANPQNWTRTGRFSRPSRPAVERLSQIRAPTLVLVGELDMPDVHAHAGAIQAGIPLVQRVVVAGAAHYVNLELPDEFNRLVTRFLRSSGRPKDLVYYDPAMERATIRSGLVYRQMGSERLEADVYLPAGIPAEAKRPAILFVVGDAEPAVLRNAKDWAFVQSYGRLATTLGFAGVTFNHRSSEDSTRLPEVRSDIDHLVRYVRTNAVALQIDPDRICLWYFSGSGAHLEAGLGTNAAFVRCIVGYYPALRPSSRVNLPEEVRIKFSASEQLKRHAPRVPPLLIAKAGRDSLSLNRAIDEFQEVATASQVPVLMLEHPQGAHAFDIRNDDETSREIVRRTLKFVEGNLGR